ncbi:MAG: hypothetical protein IKZ44_00555 [Clostridia bacterium]|nr:hypothetical protein [Clostridia bacterium]
MKQKKLLALLLAVCMVLALLPSFAAAETTGIEDVLTRATTGVTGTTYKDWTYTSEKSGVTYAGQSAGGNDSIQLRSKNSNSGIVTTVSGGKATKIVVKWNKNTTEGQTLDVYGNSTAYSAATDLYGSSAGTKIGSIVMGTSTELTITDEYAYIGLRSNNGALYLDEIDITWAGEGNVSTYDVNYKPGYEGGADYLDEGVKNPYALLSPEDCGFTAPEGKAFTGWIVEGDENAVMHAAGDYYTLTDGMTFVATWADVNTYTKITSMDEYVNGCEYLLVVASKNLAFVGNSNAAGNTVAVTIVNDSTIVGNYAANEITILIAADGNYSLKNAEGKYLYNGSGATVGFGDSARAHSIEFKEDETAWICDTTTNKYISYNPDSPGYLRYYNNSYKKVSLFKKVGGSYVEPPTPVQTCTVSFDGNGGTGNMASVTKEVGTEYTIPANKFTAPQGMRFIGWKINNEGELLNPDDVITLEEDIALFAQWQEIVLTNMEMKSELKEGDTVVIYYPTGKKVMTGEDFFYNNSKHELASDSATLTDGILAVPDTALRLTVSIDDDGKYTFATSDGRYLYADDTHVMLVNEQGANTLFQLEAAEAGEGSYYIKCDSATYNNNAEYIEFYANCFTVRTFNNDNTDIYTFQFFGEPEPETLEDGFYLIGPDWAVDDIDATQKFGANVNAGGEYILAATLAEGDQIKVVKVENGAITAWYPDGLNNQYTVDAAHAGSVNIYFREIYNNDWSVFGGYFYIEAGYNITCVSGEHGSISTAYSRASAGTEINVYVDYVEEGYALDTLTVLCDETEVETNKVNDDQYTFLMPAGDVTITATFAIPATEPYFGPHQLILDGLIGLSFNMELPTISGVDYTTSYMTFSIEHGECTESAGYNEDASFVCYVNAIQMAEPITATFHYMQNNTEKTVKETYSVEDYFKDFDKVASKYDETTVALVHAVADYGYHAQRFLSEQRGWTLGTDYAEMTEKYTANYDTDTINAIKTEVEGYKFQSVKNDDVEKITYSLIFDSATEIRVFFKMKSGYTGSFTAGAPYTATKAGARYQISVLNIPAHQLSNTYTITATTDSEGTVSVKVSALSYVRSLLANYTDTNSQNAAASVYAYSQAANAYKAAH